MSVAIRRLTAADVPAFRALLDIFGAAFDDPATDRDAQPDDAYLARLLGSEPIVALAAFDGGAPVGGLVAYELIKFERARSEFFIYDLAVAAGHRRRGVATALIAALQPIAAARGADVIFVQAGQGDAPAIALYEGLGTRGDVHHFDIATGR